MLYLLRIFFSPLQSVGTYKKKTEEEEKKWKGGKVERWKKRWKDNLHFGFESYVFLLHFLKKYN